MQYVLVLASLLAVAAANLQDYNYGNQGKAPSGLLNLFSGGSSGGCDSATGVGCGGNSGNTNGFSNGGCNPATGIGCGGNSAGNSGFSSGGCDFASGVGCGGNSGGGNIVIGNNNIGSSGSGGFTSGGGSVNCPQDRVVTVPRESTSIRQVVSTVSVPQQRTQFVTQTSLVPSFTTSIAVQTDIATRTDFRTQVKTNVNTQQVASTVRLPDTFNTRIQTVFRTQVDTQFNTQTQYVTRQDVQTSVSVINKQRQVETVVRVPQVQVSTQVVQVPGPAQTRVQTEYNTREAISYYQAPARTIVQTSTNYRTEVIPQTIRQPDTIFTVTSVNVVPFTSVIINTRFVPQYVTNTQTFANTVTRTQATTKFVQVRNTIVQNVVSVRYQTDYVTQTQQVVRTQVQQQVQTVRVPSQPRVVYRTQQVQVASTVRGADTYNTQIVQVQRPREVYTTRVVDQVQNQERVVKETRGGGYCGGGHSKGYGSHHGY